LSRSTGQSISLDDCMPHLVHSFQRRDGQVGSGASACGGSQDDDIAASPDAFWALAQAMIDLE
jgi:hypothetical protein